MKVSVVMVTYNQERFIAEAIESVLAQETDFDYELVIGEDCSTDETARICREYAARNPGKVRLLSRRSNIGARRNFVDAYSACAGEYLTILEGDDYWTCPRKLQKQADALDRHPDWAVCFHRVHCFRDDGTGEERELPQLDREAVFTLDDLLRGNFIQTCSVMLRKKSLPEIPEWYLHHQPPDWALGILHAKRGSIGYLPEVMAAYRRHPEGCWSARDPVETAGDAIALLGALASELDREQVRLARAKMAELHLERAVSFGERGARLDALLSVARSIREHPLNRRAFSGRRAGMMVRAVAPGLHRLVRRGFKPGTPEPRSAVREREEVRVE